MDAAIAIQAFVGQHLALERLELRHGKSRNRFKGVCEALSLFLCPICRVKRCLATGSGGSVHSGNPESPEDCVNTLYLFNVDSRSMA